MNRATTVYCKTLLAFLLLGCIFLKNTKGQYQNSGIVLTNAYGSAVNWIDIDGDGDLDLSISGGDIWSITYGEVYINNNSVFSFEKAIQPMLKGDMLWCDFNNDSIPDLLYAGDSIGPDDNMGLCAGIDTFNVASGFNYHALFSAFTPVGNASVDWGDYDNDGDYDVLIAGMDANENIITSLYQNSNGTFKKVDAGLPGIINGKVGFIDYDLDRDLDILFCGQDRNENKYTRLWQNNQGSYSITSQVFVNLAFSHFDWGDFNADGYPDLLLQGYDGANYRGLIYINKSGEYFSLSDTIIPGSQKGNSGFGDVDNDGDLDVFVSGSKQNASLNGNLIFFNLGTDSLVANDFSIPALEDSKFQFGDYDGDYDLDFVVNGMQTSDGNGLTLIAEDTCSKENNRPTAPEGLSATVRGTQVLLSWTGASDNNTPQKSLTYNIYLGTSSKGIDIVSPHATISNGFRKISKSGYIQDTSWLINNLPAGTYYWGVQALDNSFVPSPFSAENSFEIKERFTENSFNETPNATQPAIYFDCDHDLDYDLFLNGDDKFIIAENTGAGFSQAAYDTIYNEAFIPIKTLAPNDYNNNNCIDFTVSGDYTDGTLFDSSLFLFGYNSAFNYSVVSNSLIEQLDFEVVLWADLNNDGLQDLITSGNGANNTPVTFVYQNMGSGEFSQVAHNIRNFNQCGAVAGDFDNDMDIDLIFYGMDNSALPNTFIYLNEGAFLFTEKLIANNELFRSFSYYGIVTGDFDLNGELDIYMAGQSMENNYYSRVLLNNNLEFTDANLPIRSWAKMSNYWADYDYDGDLDIFSTSANISSGEMRLYLNTNNTLEEIIIGLGSNHQLNLPFMAANLDNTNGLDFLMKKSGGDYVQFFDNYAAYNKLSVAPENLAYHRDNLDVVLTWDKLTDCPACTYNIWVAEHPDSAFVISPMADTATGFRYVVQPGNAYMNGGWKIENLAAGTYYWSVQAVDPANTGGPWAVTDTFTIVNVNADFTFNTVCLGDTTLFTDLSVATNTVVGWKWNFGDGSTSLEQNPKHKFAIADTFLVELWAFSQTGDSSLQSHNVIVKAKPAVSFTADIACQGGITTFENQTNTNGLNIFEWKWDFGDGSSIFIKDPVDKGYLNPGTYNVKLIASAENGCVDSLSKEVEVGANPVALLSLLGNTKFCRGESAQLNVTWQPTYSYQWQLNGVNISGANVDSLIVNKSGNYSVVVVNPIGACTETSDAVAITVNDLPPAYTISVASGTTFCAGDSVLLSVPENANLKYTWYLGAGAVGTDTYKLIAKTSGKYSLKVTDNNNCSQHSADSVDVEVNGLPTKPSLDKSGPTTFCEGDSVLLSTPELVGLSYQWKNQLGQITDETNNSLSVKASGSYFLEITNSSGCFVETESVVVNVNESPDVLAVTAGSSTGFCSGDSVILSTESIEGLSYQWLKDGEIIAGATASKLSAKTSGAYNLKPTNSSGCSSISSDVNVIVYPKPATPSLSYGATSFCKGDSVALTASSADGLLYQWISGNLFIDGATTNKYVAFTEGDYKLQVMNSSNCITTTTSIPVTVNPNPDIPIITANGSTEFCLGDSVTLNTELKEGLSYQWKKDNGNTGFNTNSLKVKTEGIYGLVTSNANGCFAEAALKNITVFDLPVKPTLTPYGPTTFCGGDSLLLGIGYSAGISYQWKNSFGIIPGANDSSILIKTAGNYYLELSNANNCLEQTEKVSITVKDAPGNPIISALSDTIFCPGDSVALVTDNNPEWVYQWMRNDNGIGSNAFSYLAQHEGSYSLKITNSNGCFAWSSNTIHISHHPLPSTPVILYDGNTAFCKGDSLLLHIDEVSGCSAKWLWYGTAIANNSWEYKAGKEGDYTVELINTSNCKSLSKTLNISTWDSPNPVPINPKLTDLCQGEVQTLSVPEQQGFNYQWFKDGAEIEGEIYSETNVDEEGIYTVKISNEHNCAYQPQNARVKVFSVPAAQSIIPSGETLICPSEELTLAVESNPEYGYLWYFKSTASPGDTLHQLLAGGEGTYEVDIFNRNNPECKISTPVLEITHKPALNKPTLKAEGPNVWVLACDNSSAQVYRWYYNGDIIRGANGYTYVADQKLGEYYVTVNDGGECHVPSNIVSIPLNATGITEANTAFGDIKIYPNPTTSMFTVEMENPIIGTLHIRIVNEQGKELFNIKHNKTTRHLKTQMDLNGQGDGVYFIQFRFEEDVEVKKVVVE